MRHYYHEWSKWMGRSASDPDQPAQAASAIAAE
jgi:hypothetical protein